jgi:hypothetical protein
VQKMQRSKKCTLTFQAAKKSGLGASESDLDFCNWSNEILTISHLKSSKVLWPLYILRTRPAKRYAQCGLAHNKLPNQELLLARTYPLCTGCWLAGWLAGCLPACLPASCCYSYSYSYGYSYSHSYSLQPQQQQQQQQQLSKSPRQKPIPKRILVN